MQNSKTIVMKLFTLIILTSIVISSCFKDRIDLELEQENKDQIVITGWLNNLDEDQVIKVSKLSAYLGSLIFEGVSEADVLLREGTSEYVLKENKMGIYHLPSDWIPVMGEEYELEVRYRNEVYTAIHKMHPCPEIERLRIGRFIEKDPTDSIHIYVTAFDFTDFDGTGDGYYGVDYLKGSIAGDSLDNGKFINDQFIDGEKLDEIVLTDGDRRFQLGDTAVVELYSIGTETSDYLQDINDEVYRDGPFDPPPTNVRTNFTGGAVGYFIISDARRAELVIE